MIKMKRRLSNIKNEEHWVFTKYFFKGGVFKEFSKRYMHLINANIHDTINGKYRSYIVERVR